jgi:hypothetical protein
MPSGTAKKSLIINDGIYVSDNLVLKNSATRVEASFAIGMKQVYRNQRTKVNEPVRELSPL